MSAPFDREALRQRRDRAAKGEADAHFLMAEVVDRLVERLDDVTRPFPRAAVVGAWRGEMARALLARPGTESVVQVEPSLGLARLAAEAAPVAVGDEERLPLAPGSLDLIVAPLLLHWTNDLPGALIQMRRALRPDGLLLAAMLGAGTLAELRGCLTEAEVEATGGLSPRFAPLAEIRDLGGLLQRAGLALPVADREAITVRYGDPLRLLRDLRAMAETAALAERRRVFLRREVLARGLALYAERHADAEGRVTATFELAFLHGWAPHESQQQPLRPGSAKMRLAEALGTEERRAGDTVPGDRARGDTTRH